MLRIGITSFRFAFLWIAVNILVTSVVGYIEIISVTGSLALLADNGNVEFFLASWLFITLIGAVSGLVLGFFQSTMLYLTGFHASKLWWGKTIIGLTTLGVSWLILAALTLLMNWLPWNASLKAVLDILSFVCLVAALMFQGFGLGHQQGSLLPHIDNISGRWRDTTTLAWGIISFSLLLLLNFEFEISRHWNLEFQIRSLVLYPMVMLPYACMTLFLLRKVGRHLQLS